MDKFNFNKLVENPFLIKPEDITSLQKIVELYPYCQPARILLTKAMHLAGDLNYEKTLNQTAIGMAERQKLKYWITTSTTTLAIDSIEASSTKEQEFTNTPLNITKLFKGLDRTPPTDDLLKNVEESLSALRHTRNKAIGLEDGLVTIPQVNIFEKILPFEQLPTPPIKEETKELPVPFVKRNRQQLPQGLINDFVKTEKPAETELFKPAAESTEFFDYTAYKETRKAAKTNATKDQEKVDEIAKDFPNMVSTTTTGIESSTLGESISEESEASLLLNYLEHTKKKKRLNTVSKEQVNSILSNFIASEPTIKPAKNLPRTDNEIDLSVKSTRFQGTPISENFAELLVTQGKFLKAVEVFEELVLKYPEKKSYFAVRIEELKNKLNT